MGVRDLGLRSTGKLVSNLLAHDTNKLGSNLLAQHAGKLVSNLLAHQHFRTDRFVRTDCSAVRGFALHNWRSAAAQAPHLPHFINATNVSSSCYEFRWCPSASAPGPSASPPGPSASPSGPSASCGSPTSICVRLRLFPGATVPSSALCFVALVQRSCPCLSLCSRRLQCFFGKKTTRLPLSRRLSRHQ